MQAPIILLPYVDPCGELQVFASDAEGRWRSNVNFIPGIFSQGNDDGVIRCQMTSWKKSCRLRVETAHVLALNPNHLQVVKAMLTTKLNGLEVTITDAGVVVTDRMACNREKVETAIMWLSLAGQYVALKTQFDLHTV